MAIKRFAQATKFRIISGNADFITTAKAIRNGVGSSVKFNAATQKALDALEYIQPSVKAQAAAMQLTPAAGLVGVWEGVQIQIDKV